MILTSPSHRRKSILLLILINLVCLTTVFIIHKKLANPLQHTEIILTKNGFVPKDISITQNTEVTFKTTTGKRFWPASDPHPTHTIFPAFDPRHPVDSSDTWSFTFQKIGIWKFHDHLNPYFTGTITVTNKTGDTPALSFCKNISTLPLSEKIQCWDNTMETILTTQGLDKGFDYLEHMYLTDPDFQAQCHDFAHKLGDKAFSLYLEKKDFQPSAKAYYCGYGFYHGFMEKLLHTTNDVKQAQGFCDYVDKKLHTQTIDAGGACMHGIGHGTVADTPDPALWGNAQGIIDRGLKQCEQVVRNDSERFRCASGVYNAYEILASAHEYKLSHNPQDPFSICRTQLEKYKNACYPQLTVVALNFANRNWTKAIAYADSIKEDSYALPAAEAILVERVREQEDFSILTRFCSQIPKRFHDICIQSYAEGFLKYGPPQNEYKQGLAYCGSDSLTNAEKKLCYTKLLGLLRNLYTADKTKSICLTAPKEYQYHSCMYE